jgi:hypothetical protein
LAVALLCGAAVQAAPPVGVQAAPAPAATLYSPVTQWELSLPAAACARGIEGGASEVSASIGSEFEGRYPAFSHDEKRDRLGLANVGALYDPVHRIAAFDEHGTDLAETVFVGDVGTPPVSVRDIDLSPFGMGGKVHLGDTLAKVESAFGVHPALTRCGALSTAAFYGPPHPAGEGGTRCKSVGADFQALQILGVVVFRAGRVAALAWNETLCT